ncbi:MAG TPA: hypothetical protein VHM20_01485 [Gammaproteobacteria bacterium]|nr:hypothetical protein [Gammaproteobacteria bacterium]
MRERREIPDVEKAEITPPPHYRPVPKIKQQSQVMPELKRPLANNNFFSNFLAHPIQNTTTFFRSNPPLIVGAGSGAVGIALTWLAYSVGPMLFAIPPAAIGGIVGALVGGGGKWAFEKREECKKNSAPKGPTP